MKKYGKWIIFVAILVLSIASQIYIQQRYTSLFAGGVEYQWPVTLERKNQWVPSDYLQVKFLGSHALWTGEHSPSENQEIYVLVNVRKDGLLVVHSATNQKPKEGPYILAYAKKFESGIVEFDIPFNRVKVDLSKVNPKFYQNYKGVILATIKLEEGKGVITGLYSKGEPLETAVPASLGEQAAQSAKVNVIDILDSTKQTADSENNLGENKTAGQMTGI